MQIVGSLFGLGKLRLYTLGGLLDHHQFLSLSAIDWRQVVRDDLVLPIAYHPVSLGLLSQVVLILYVHPSVVLEIAHREFVHFLSKQFLTVLCVQGLVNAHFLFVFRLLPENELFHAILGHLVVHIRCRPDLKITS